MQATQSIVDDFRWRGLIHVTDDGQELLTPGLEELLGREMVTAYIGFDPSADSLHIGNLLGIMALVRMQRQGHRPICHSRRRYGTDWGPGRKVGRASAAHSG